MSESLNLGPRLSPPSGGLARLQQAVRFRGHPKRRNLGAPLLIPAILTAAFFMGSSFAVITIRRDRFVDAVHQALASAETTQFQDAAYRVLPSRSREQKILLIGVLPAQRTCARPRHLGNGLSQRPENECGSER